MEVKTKLLPAAYEPSVLQTAYQLIRPLSDGGMSNLWLVRDLACNRMAVMKTASADVRSDPMANDRFKAENRILARLSHPNIVQLYGVFLFAERRAMVMEMIDGVNLTDFRKNAALPIETALDFVQQILAGLSYAHSEGVTHRDIKPANVMINRQGKVKIVDFGISKCAQEPDRTYPGTTMGSAYYMAPEQILGMAIDNRCDLYSVGIILYELLTGERPYNSATSFGVMEQHLKMQPEAPHQVNPKIPRSLSKLILKAIAKRPADRFQTAEDFAAALHQAYKLPKASTQKAMVLYQEPKPKTVVRIRLRYPAWLAPVARKLCGTPRRSHYCTLMNPYGLTRIMTTPWLGTEAE